VPRVEAGGHDIAGLRRPGVAVPRATRTGWNLYAEPFPAGDLYHREGSLLPFAATQAERDARGDPQSRWRNAIRTAPLTRRPSPAPSTACWPTGCSCGRTATGSWSAPAPTRRSRDRRSGYVGIALSHAEPTRGSRDGRDP
jgi:hypothetical protein